MRSVALLAALLTPVLLATAASAAGPDNNVEWNGVSHIAWQDRRPVCPRSNETFQVRFQAYQNDLTAARVQVDDGGTLTWITAATSETRGVYDIWTAQVPATTSPTPSYYIEVTDGTDTDFMSVNGMSDLAPTDGGFALNFTTLEHAPVGATPVAGGTVFRVWAPTRSSVKVPGEFNGWSTAVPSLIKTGEHFIGFVAGASPRQQYKFLFNGTHWNSDARSRAVDPTNNYNSILEDPFGYTWVSGDFATPPLESMVIYQLHVGTFPGRNDPLGTVPFPGGFSDVAARVGHLAELGVNAVMLNPIFEFPGDESAGYNPVSAWAPEWIYGTPDEFKNLVDVCHQNGIAVLLDIVWNHFSSTDNFLWNYDGTQTYFDSPAVGTPWGDQADFDEPEVADYFAQSSLYLMEEFRIDGYRMDATDFMNMPPQDAAGWALMQRLNDEMDNRFASKVAIAEQLPDDAWVTRPTSLGGAGFDSQYWDAFTDELRQEIFDSASGSPEIWRLVNLVNGGGLNLSNQQATNYLELHDEAWPTSGGQRIVKTIDTTSPHDDSFAKGRSKLGQGFVMLAPGVPAMLQGTEWLEDTDFGTSSAERIDWSKKTTYAGIYQFYRDLIALRTGTQAFWANSAHQVTHSNEAGDVIAFTRSGGGETFLVVVNLGSTDYDNYRVGVPTAGAWAELLNSQSALYEGNGEDNATPVNSEAVGQDGFGQSVLLNLAPMTIAVYQDAGAVVDAPQIAETTTDGVNLRFANPVSAGTSIAFTLPAAGHVTLDLLDARGRRVATLQDGIVSAGEHRATWDGRTNGARVGAGVYFLRLVTAQGVVTRKITLVR